MSIKRGNMQKEAVIILLAVILVASVGGIFLIKENYGQATLIKASQLQQITAQKLPSPQQISAQTLPAPWQITIPPYNASNLTSSKYASKISAGIQPQCPVGTVIPTSNMVINQSTTFCPGTYNVIDISVQGSNIVLDCNGANFIGDFNFRTQPTYSASGSDLFKILSSSNVEIKNCNLSNYHRGVSVFNSGRISIHNNVIQRSAIGMLLWNVNKSEVFENRIEGMVFIGIIIENSPRNQIYENNLHNFTISWLVPGEVPVQVCPGTGITVVGSLSDLNEIRLNNIEKMCNTGIEIYDSRQNKVVDNHLKTIFYKGIRTYNAWESIIEDNIVENTPFTIILDLTNQAIIKKNNLYLINTNDPQDNQAVQNTWTNNFYSDLNQVTSSCTDANSDNICDNPRQIYGTTGSTDQTPSKIPN